MPIQDHIMIVAEHAQMGIVVVSASIVKGNTAFVRACARRIGDSIDGGFVSEPHQAIDWDFLHFGDSHARRHRGFRNTRQAAAT